MDPIIVHLVMSRLRVRPVMPRRELVAYFATDMRYRADDARDVVELLVRGGYLREAPEHGTDMLCRGPKLAMVLPTSSGLHPARPHPVEH